MLLSWVRCAVTLLHPYIGSVFPFLCAHSLEYLRIELRYLSPRDYFLHAFFAYGCGVGFVLFLNAHMLPGDATLLSVI